ncbi:glycoside hydrolase family 128 protein [Aaosphaeria arxii CBS 175.79]|uniref:Glycoside hydrolase family 128 protein n=1 Tax=Aaosphaeria arxii CBS 175.79 TaxID=1450172 RepID=A0A6A5X6K3_9PLEO|nr:glycoside hydrolase family 128 protein [Aaosphaeria arxii CBS 175.79]KAF2008506.1 glycoside hydrolase family 128 protein [Aaosphaeria arxii CBS 175.79]
MSSPMKLSLLALISSVAAVPHYAHSRYHKPSAPSGVAPSGSPLYPTGGFPGSNSTVPYPTGTGVSVPGEKTTTLHETLYSTETIVSTIYATRPAPEAPSSVGAVDVSTGAPVCGPATVYVTETAKVTLTVGATPSSSSAAEAVSSEAVTSAPPSAYPVAPAPSSSSLKLSLSYKPVEGVYSAPAEAPAPSSSEAAPVSSAPAATSSEVVKPTGSPSYSGGKRGLAYNDAELCSAFSGGNFGFAHNWDKAPGGELPEGVQFIPTCHRPALYETEEQAKTWFSAVDDAVKSGSKAIQGFNEPDEPTQFPISTDKACSEWIRLMNPAAEAHPDLTVLSLSVTNGGEAHKGLNYLKTWADSCPEAVWHAASIHFYDNYDADVINRFKAHVEKAAGMFNKPVWVTEFSLNKGTATEEQAASFVKEAAAYLDSAEHVAGYSYFMVGTGEYQLNSASGLSAVGEAYKSA